MHRRESQSRQEHDPHNGSEHLFEPQSKEGPFRFVTKTYSTKIPRVRPLYHCFAATELASLVNALCKGRSMAKDNPPKPKGIPNKHLHARITFLYQAATYLTLHTSVNSNQAAVKDADPSVTSHTEQSSPLAIQLGSDLHTVSRKAQLRLSVDLKRSMCKSCNAVLVPGHTATQVIDNQSKGGKKPWADVLVIICNRCGSKKRLPVGAKRQPKKRARLVAAETATTSDMEGVESTTPAVHTATEQSHSSD